MLSYVNSMRRLAGTIAGWLTEPTYPEKQASSFICAPAASAGSTRRDEGRKCSISFSLFTTASRSGKGLQRPLSEAPEPKPSEAADRHQLGFQVFLEAFEPGLAPQAALLPPDERGLDGLWRPFVDADHPELQSLGRTNSRAQVVRPHVRRKAVARPVRERDGLVDVPERSDGQHRTEDFLAVHRHRRINPGHNGGPIE